MARAKRPETFAEVRAKLTTLERLNIGFIRWTFENPTMNALMDWCHRVFGVSWVHHCTKHIRHVHGLERIAEIFDGDDPVIFASNHRSFFDMYVINMVVARAGFHNRLLFPVRSTFFYDHPLGFFVNFIMSWFSMYPPIFRDRKRAVLNHVAFGELSRDLTAGRAVGIHPEGTRKRDDDPYTFLPAQRGVGRLIHLANAKVVPIFINGLGNDLKRQVTGNFDGTGNPVIIVFGTPTRFEDLCALEATPKTFKAIADRCMELIGELGQEEKALRAQLTESQSDHAPSVG